MNHLVEILTLKLIFQVMQQNQILKMFHMLILQVSILQLDTSLKTNLSSLKSEVNKLDTDKLVAVPVDLSKLSGLVKNDVVKNDVSDKLVTKVNNIDTSGFVLKTKYDTDKSELVNKIPDTSGLVKKTDYNTKNH